MLSPTRISPDAGDGAGRGFCRLTQFPEASRIDDAALDSAVLVDVAYDVLEPGVDCRLGKWA